MSDQRTQLTATVSGLERGLKDVEAEIREAIRVATRKVEAEFEPRRSAASAALSKAREALREHINATAAHPWEGKVVEQSWNEAVNRWSSKFEKKTRRGVVEVHRNGTQFPANMRYGLPALGEAFVRILKKDGTPGTQFDKLGGSNSRQGAWYLADGEGA